MKMKSYRKKEKFLVLMTLVVLLGLLFISCPNNTTTPPDKFTVGGIDYFFSSVSIPPTIDGIQRDVMVVGTTIFVTNIPVKKVRIIDAIGRGGDIDWFHSGGTVTGLTFPIKVYGDSGAGWYEAKDQFFDPAVSSKSFIFNGLPQNATNLIPFSPPSPTASPGAQRDVMFVGTTVTVRATVDLIIVDNDGYSCNINGVSTGGTIVSSTSPGLTSPIRVYGNSGSGWYEVNGVFNDPPVVNIHSHDFTSQFTLLGLSSGSDVTGDMATRWNNAKTAGNPKFYPISSTPSGQITVNSSVNYHYTQIYGGDPMIRFIVDGSDIRVFASDGTGVASSITFDIAVFKSDGKGWFTPGTPTTVPGAGSPQEIPAISISSVTNSKISNISGLSSGGYKVYAIVRNADALNYLDTDLNNHYWMKTVNVIRIYPDAEIP